MLCNGDCEAAPALAAYLASRSATIIAQISRLPISLELLERSILLCSELDFLFHRTVFHAGSLLINGVNSCEVATTVSKRFFSRPGTSNSVSVCCIRAVSPVPETGLCIGHKHWPECDI